MSVQIVMPKAGLTMVEGTISEWKMAEGASVNKGDVLMEYENEKNSIECVALASGILHILAKEGDTVPVGEAIGELAQSQAEYASMVGTAASTASTAPTASEPIATAVPTAVVSLPSTADKRFGGRIRATGLAKKMSKEAGINIADIIPSGGPDGTRIVAKDVAAYLAAAKNIAVVAKAAPVLEKDEITEIPWTGVRKTIARNMLNSLQQSAQCTATCEMDVTELLAMRQKLVEQQAFLGCKITINDLICMAVTKMLMKHPLANATFDGKTLFSHKHVNLSVAVATEDGLMVPVVKHADGLSLVELSKTIKDLGARAKEKKLRDGEQGGGTFTVSNVGMFPIDMSTPIINPPEVAVMGFGRTTKKPVYIDGTFVPRDVLCCYLTFDHRVLDGLEVGRIFQDMQLLIEHPELITV